LEASELHDNFQEENAQGVVNHISKGGSGANLEIPCKPLSQWQCLTPRGIPSEIQLQSRPTPKKVAAAHGTTSDLTRFQRFIRTMEGAGPKAILDRLKEDWQLSTGEGVDEEVCGNVMTLRELMLTAE
jgi:hypothetical protein